MNGENKGLTHVDHFDIGVRLSVEGEVGISSLGILEIADDEFVARRIIVMLLHLLEEAGLGIDEDTHFMIGAAFLGLEVDDGSAVLFVAYVFGTKGLIVVGQQNGGIGQIVLGGSHGRNHDLLGGLVVLPDGLAVGIDFQVVGLHTIARRIIEHLGLLPRDLLLICIAADNGYGEADCSRHFGSGFFEQRLCGLVDSTFGRVGELGKDGREGKDGQSDEYEKFFHDMYL